MPSPRRQPSEEYDLSSIQPPVKLGINGAEQVARCLAGGSEEIKHLLRQECRIIFECCACTSLFRSLANFLAHKRVYCKDDHMLPSSDLASHVSILRQYIQTKAAAMATLAEGANNQSNPTGTNADTPPEQFVANNGANSAKLQNGMKSDETKTEVANHGETPKKKKPKPANSQTPKTASSADTPPDSNQEKFKSPEKGSSAAKKRRLCDSIPNNVKKSQVKRKLMGGIPAEGMNGELNIADTFMNHKDLALVEDSTKKNKAPKTKATISLKSMECSVVMNEKDIVPPPPIESVAATASVPTTKPTTKPTRKGKSTKTDMAPHLLYPCLYCENVFPGTRMAIDHITAVHKKRKAINVSKIRTKIRKKAFVVKSGKKTRRFQKKPKTPEKEKDEDSSSEEKDGKDKDTSVDTSPDDTKGGKRHVPHCCSHCGKSYAYKTAMLRHQVGCTAKQEHVSSNGEPQTAEAVKVSTKASPISTSPKPVSVSPTTVSSSTKTVSMSTKTVSASTKTVSASTKTVSASTKTVSASTKTVSASTKTVSASTKMVPTSTKTVSVSTKPVSSSSKPIKSTPISTSSSSQKSTLAAKKVLNLKGSSSGSSISPNCRVLGEIVLSPCDTIKTEPSSPFSDLLNGEMPDFDASTSSTPGKDKERAIIIPVKSEYPCPYCMIKPKKTFALLFAHISDKHKDLRPSRKRVVRFLMNSGYKCSWCKSPPRFFKNRVMLRRHREKEHGMNYITPSLVKANGAKS